MHRHLSNKTSHAGDLSIVFRLQELVSAFFDNGSQAPSFHEDADTRKVKRDAKSRDAAGVAMELYELDLAMARLIAADAGAAEDSKLKEEVEVLKKICQKKKAKQSSRS